MPSTRQRVPSRTSADVNERIRAGTAERVRYYEQNRQEIPDRLRALGREWDIERAIEANASVLAFAGIAAAALRNDKRWLVLPALVTGFLFQHAIQGWCPPIPILRRLGFRTSYEIEDERQALKALRGDFNRVARAKNRPVAALRAARA